MSIEIVVMVFASIGAVVDFVVAYREKKKDGKALLPGIVCFVCTVVAGTAGLEEYWRRESMETLPAQLEREWTILKDTAVLGIELEVMSPDGLLTDGLLAYAKDVRLELPANALGAGPLQDGQLPFAQWLTIEQLKEHGRVGINVSKVQTREVDQKKSIEKFDRADCIASRFITRSELEDARDALQRACSAMVVVPLPEGTLRLGDIEKWPRVAVTERISREAKCLGVCEDPFIVSVRLALASGSNLAQDLIEISPSVLEQHATRSSDNDQILTFERSGQTILELAHSFFIESYGNRQRESFAFTRGLIHSLYQRSTTQTQTARLLDIVWTTDPAPEEQTLRGALAPAARASANSMELKEWCGFASHKVCWHRFSMWESQAGSIN